MRQHGVVSSVSNDAKSTAAFIEEIMINDGKPNDTLLYFKFFFDSINPILKLKKEINLGVTFIRTAHSDGGVYSLAYFGPPFKSGKEDTLMSFVGDGNLAFFNATESLGAKNHRSMHVVRDGKIKHRLIYSDFTEETEMVRTLWLFNKELKKGLGNSNCVRYISTISDDLKIAKVEKTYCY